MVPMIAPDGTTGSIPQAQVQGAVQAGGKLGVRISAPDGTAGTIPMDRVHEAINAGGQLIGMSDVAKPNVKMQEALGAPSQAAMQPDPLLVGLSATGASEGGYSDPGKAAATTA